MRALFLILISGSALAVLWLLHPLPTPRATIVRLVDRLAEARRVEQRNDLIEPEILRLKAGVVRAPPGWQTVPGEVAHFVAPSPRPIHLRIEVPIDGGRDYVIRATARDASKRLRMLVQHAPSPEQPEPGWHLATEERATSGRVRFDWREDTPPDEKVLPIVLESEPSTELVLESLSVREAGAGDPAIVEAAPAVTLHGLVDRPVDGAVSQSKRGARRLLSSLLASDGGVYEWALEAPPQAELRFSTATVPHGPVGAAPIEMTVEVETANGWQRAWMETRGAAGDSGAWRDATLPIPRDARALRLSTHALGQRPAVVAWGNPTLRDPQRSKRHVVLITLDAVRPDHLGSYGYSRATSPFFDKLASRGARFTDVTAQRSHTWASTTSLLSGLLPQTSGVVARGDRPLRGLPGLAEFFAHAGYSTVRIGSPDLPRGQLPGFDDTEVADSDSDVVNRLSELGRAYADGPLFIWAHVSTAHYPWTVAPEFNRFDPEWRGPYASSITRAQFRALEDKGPIGGPLKQHLTALYDDAILQMDQRVGAALAKLDDVGFFDDAIICVTADHGAHFGEHDVWFMHSTPWHAAMQAPLIVVAPGKIAPGSVIDRRALLVDVAPTLLELAGVPFSGLDGANLLSASPDRTTVTRFDPASYVTVENDRFKLLWNPKRESLSWPGELTKTISLPEMALFDRIKDPDETTDISAAHPDIVANLRRAAERDASEREAGAGARLSTEARRLLQQAGYLEEE